MRVLTICGATTIAVALLPFPTSAQRVIDLPAADLPLPVEFEEVYRVGGADAPAWAAFQRVFHVAFDGAGRLYVGDPQGRRVVVVARDGRFERAIGRDGEGPGEFRSVAAMTATRNGAVIVFDFNLRRFTLFEPGRDPLIRPLENPADLPGSQLRALPDGAVVSAQLGLSISGGDVEHAPGVPLVRHDVRASGRGVEIHRAWYPADQRPGGPQPLRSMPWKGFESGVFVAPLPDGRIALADTTDFRIELLSPDGVVTTILRRPIRPLPVSDRFIEREKQSRRDRWNDPGNRASVTTSGGDVRPERPRPSDPSQVRLQGYLDAMVFPAHLPVIVRMATDWTGRLWVQRSGADPWTRGPTDVISPDGRYLGTLPPPSAPGVPDAFGPDGLGAWIEKDEFDAPVIVVRRVRAHLPAGPGP